MVTDPIDLRTGRTYIPSLTRRASVVALLALTVGALVGPGEARAQSAEDALGQGPTDIAWTLVEEPLLRSRGHDFVSVGEAVGNEDAFLITRHRACGDDCLQILRSTDGLAGELIVIDGPGRAILDLAASDDGFLALAVDGPGIYQPTADTTWHVYTSVDGRSWSGHLVDPTRPGDVIHAVTSGPGGLVAVGCDTRTERLGDRARRDPYCRQAVVWSSVDGSEWTREEPDGGRLVELQSVAAVGDTIVAGGADFSAGRNEEGRPAILTRSTDGIWSRTEPASVDRGLLAVQASPAHGFVVSPTVDWGLLGHGSVAFDAPISERLVSDDGIEWTALPEPRIGTGSNGALARVTAMAEGHSGSAVIAATRTPRPGRRGAFLEAFHLWQSDGETWRSTSLPAGGYLDDDETMIAIGPGGRALLVNGSGIILIAGPEASGADDVAVGPIPGRAAVPPSPLGSLAQTTFLAINADDPGACFGLRGRDVRRSAPAASAGLECGVGDGERRVRHYLFHSEADLEAWWAAAFERGERVGSVEVEDAVGQCSAGLPAAGAWGTADGSLSGRIACAGRDAESVVAWTTPAALIGSELRAEADAMQDLAEWFAQGRTSLPADALGGSDTSVVVPVRVPEPIDPRTRRESERALRTALSPFACKPWREDDEPFMFGAHAAIRCAAPAPGVSQLALFAFDDAEQLGTFWTWRRDRISPLLDWEAGCRDGREGATMWEHGSAACFVKREGRGTAQIRWTDTRTDTYGVLDATTADLPGLVAWWQANDPSSLAPPSLVSAEDLDARLPPDVAGQLRYLRARVKSPSRCRPMSSTALARTEPGAIAGLDCTPTRRERNDAEMTSLRYLLFPSTRSMDSWWERSRAQAAPGGLPRDSGTFRMCGSFFSNSPVETGWITRDRSSSGRLLCAPWPGLRWTVIQDLVAGSTDASGWWFARAHPDHVQRYRRLGPDEKPQGPFAPPSSLLPLPQGIGEEATGQETYVVRPTSGRGLPVGVIHPIPLGHCDGLGFSPDVDGSFWQVTGGIDPDGKAVRRNAGNAQFGQGGVVEFLKISKDHAQVRTETGYIYGYERHPGKRRFYPCA